LPSEDDILRTRVKTTGNYEYTFVVDKNKFKIIDVGGQQNLREKWIKEVDNVSTVIYLAAISEYDQKLREDPTKVFTEFLLKIESTKFLIKKFFFPESSARIPRPFPESHQK
jgi:hypothetical protein